MDKPKWHGGRCVDCEIGSDIKNIDIEFYYEYPCCIPRNMEVIEELVSLKIKCKEWANKIKKIREARVEKGRMSRPHIVNAIIETVCKHLVKIEEQMLEVSE